MFRLKLRFWKMHNTPATDGSIIPDRIFQEYFESDQYKEMIESRNGLGALTHRVRDSKCNPEDFQAIKSCVGKDDGLLVVDSRMSAPIWYIERMYFDDGWVCADMVVLDESGADPSMSDQIKRFKTLIRNGVCPGVSAVVVAYWNGNGNGTDICQKIQAIKGIDVTLNPAQKGARVLEVLDEDDEFESQFYTSHNFSDVDIRAYKSGEAVMKTFSDSLPEYASLPKTSKINLKFTNLKVKQFSAISQVEVLDDIQAVGDETNQKEFSVVGLKDRFRLQKLSPRQHFRRLILDYRQMIKSFGSHMKEEDEKILKALFVNDVLAILKEIHPEILKGKQISTLLGASSLGKSTRVAAQKLQIPYKMASKEVEKNGAVTPVRFKKLSEAYLDFVKSMTEDVFGNSTNVHLPEEEEEEQVEK